MVRKNIRILAFILCGLAAWSPTSTAADEEKQTANKVKGALDDRLRDLEGEERTLEELVKRLKEGGSVKPEDVLKMWLPPALGLVETPRPFDALDFTQEAAGLATGLLEERREETEELDLLKARIMSGDDLGLSDVVRPGEFGLEGKLKILEAEENDLKALRLRLEELLFDERFNRAAKLDMKLDANKGFPLKEADPETKETVEVAPPEREPEQKPEIDIQRFLDAPKGVDRFALAEALYRTGRYKKALAVYERIDRASHEKGDRVLYMIARCKERMKDYESAKESYEQVKRNFPDSFWAKQSDFALEMVEWRINFGPIRGAPEEAYRVMRHAIRKEQPGGGS